MSPSHDSDSGIGNDAGGFTPSPETISQADASETQANGSHASTTGLCHTLSLKYKYYSTICFPSTRF